MEAFLSVCFYFFKSFPQTTSKQSVLTEGVSTGEKRQL